MTTTNANLFKDQYFEINLATAKILTKKNITTYSEYSIQRYLRNIRAGRSQKN